MGFSPPERVIVKAFWYTKSFALRCRTKTHVVNKVIPINEGIFSNLNYFFVCCFVIFAPSWFNIFSAALGGCNCVS